MTPEIAVVLGTIVVAIVLFITERLPMELVALLVLVGLAVSGLLTPAEALSWFSNPAVVTVWAVFILSGGMARTGVAGLLGRQVLRLSGHRAGSSDTGGEVRLLVVIMLTAGIMSAFMNNVGVAALLLPVVMDIARRTGRPPSRLLMPLAFGSLLGGLNTLIGTPPNILISDALRDYGLRSFQLFDYTPVGLPITLAGVAFMVLVGRHLLPSRDPVKEELPNSNARNLREFYGLQERLFLLRLPADSPLAGRTLAQSRLGAILGLNVVAILRNRRTQLAPKPDTLLHAGDRLLVQGRLEPLADLARDHLLLEEGALEVDRLVSSEMGIAEIRLSPECTLVGQTLLQSGFRRRFGVNVLALRRGETIRRVDVRDLPLQAGDTLLVQGPRAALESLHSQPGFEFVRPASDADVAAVYHLHERLVALHVPADSTLVGRTLADGRLGAAFGLTVLGIQRGGTTRLMPGPDEEVQAHDTLLVEGRPGDLSALRGLESLEVEQQPPTELGRLESAEVGLAEVVLSPYTTLVGKTLREIHFREKYGLSVLAIWREGRPYRSDLGAMALRLGDALLLYGSYERLKVLGSEPDFLVLTEGAQAPPRLERAPWAVGIMAAVLLPVILGWVPISIAAVAGAVLMVLTGCLTMEEAYRHIEWQAVFLIAGMLPLAVAMEQTGTAQFLAEGLVALLGGLGPYAIVVGLFLLGTAATQVMPSAAVAVLLAPMAFNTAADLGVSPFPLLMTVAMAASASFLSPVAHPANLFIMGPGGYRFVDYIRVGLPLTLVVLAVLLLALPVFWPF
jgi:di/tricarboxylate transporter